MATQTSVHPPVFFLFFFYRYVNIPISQCLCFICAKSNARPKITASPKGPRNIEPVLPFLIPHSPNPRDITTLRCGDVDVDFPPEPMTVHLPETTRLMVFLVPPSPPSPHLSLPFLPRPLSLEKRDSVPPPPVF